MNARARLTGSRVLLRWNKGVRRVVKDLSGKRVQTLFFGQKINSLTSVVALSQRTMLSLLLGLALAESYLLSPGPLTAVPASRMIFRQGVSPKISLSNFHLKSVSSYLLYPIPPAVDHIVVGSRCRLRAPRSAVSPPPSSLPRDPSLTHSTTPSCEMDKTRWAGGGINDRPPDCRHGRARNLPGRDRLDRDVGARPAAARTDHRL